MTMPRRDPDVRGDAGRAWRIKMPAKPERPDWTASLDSWLVNGKGFHPAWEWWQIGVVHLRPIEGVRPAVKHYPEAEFEFMIISLDPDAGEPDPDDPGAGYKYLMPIDCVVQFDGITDAQAGKLAEMAASIIAHGKASPDQDWRTWWKTAIKNSVEHAQLGGHVNAPGGSA